MKTLKQQALCRKFLITLLLATTAGLYSAVYAEDPAPSSAKVAVESAAISPKPHGTGRITGQVYFPEQDRYLESVRVLINGTDKVALTDDTGTFNFIEVPEGTVTLTAIFTGFNPQTKIVVVAAGATATADIDIVVAPKKDTPKDDIVVMDKFMVTTGRGELASAIADQEQRYAVNMKNVVSTDEFGVNPTGNIGEFLRHIPGVEVEANVSGEARTVALGGASDDYVPVQLGGMDFASAPNPSGTGRTVQLQSFSINNISRMEVSFSPTPESPGGALGGTINMVPRGAFESKRAKFSFSTYLIMSDREFTLGRSPGPAFEPEKKTKPSWNFTYVVPVNKNFGFTLSGGYNFSSFMSDRYDVTWRGINTTFDSGHPAPNAANPYSRPYISGYTFSINASMSERDSAAITADWRLGRADRLSFGLQYSATKETYGMRERRFSITTISIEDTNTEHMEGTGYLRSITTARHREARSYMPSLRYSHIGPLWKIEAAAGLSRDDSKSTDTDEGYFRSVYADRAGITMIMDRRDDEMVPYNIKTSITASNTDLDFRSMDEFVITESQSLPMTGYNEKRTYYANIRRDLMILGVPVFLKAGVDIRHQINDRDYDNAEYRYLGADGVYPYDTGNDRPSASGTPAASDNDAAPFVETIPYTQVNKLTGLGNVQYANNALVYNLYKEHPTLFQRIRSGSNDTDSRHAEETISSGFFRGDFSFLDNRLYVVGGVRMEETHVTGQGPTRIPDENGVLGPWIKRGSNNAITSSAWFPSANAQYKFGSKLNWVLRASWFKSIGRPSFGIYNGAVQLPELGSDPADSDNFIRVPGGTSTLQPWTAYTWRGELTWYFGKRGMLSLTGFTRDYTNLHISSIAPLTEEIRGYYNIPSAYMDHYVVTTTNSPNKSNVKELTLSYRQALTFLPDWARGISARASMTFRSKSGADSKTFSGVAYAPRSYRAGLAYEKKRLTLRADGTYRPRYVESIYNNVGLENGVRSFMSTYTTVSASMEYQITKHISFFADGSNFLNEPVRAEVGGPSTPGGTKIANERYYGGRYTFGIKGSY